MLAEHRIKRRFDHEVRASGENREQHMAEPVIGRGRTDQIADSIEMIRRTSRQAVAQLALPRLLRFDLADHPLKALPRLFALGSACKLDLLECRPDRFDVVPETAPIDACSCLGGTCRRIDLINPTLKIARIQ